MMESNENKMDDAILIDIKPSFNLKISARSGNGQKKCKKTIFGVMKFKHHTKYPVNLALEKNFIKHRTEWLISASTVLETAM